MSPTFGPWIERAADLRADFEQAHPFPHLVLDGFLDDAFAHEVLAEFPGVDEMPKSRDYVFGDKRELSSVEARGPACRRLYDALTGPEFAEALRLIHGKELFVDPAFHGGGFHQGSDGSFLDMHVDFNVHPLHEDWLRTINILIYMSEDWLPEYGGELLVTTDPSIPTTPIRPQFNRGLLMVTNDRTYHGYEKMSLPPGITRKSIATYAYEHIQVGSVHARTTGWAPAQGGVGKKLFAKYYDPMVKVKTKLLGSATSRNR